MPDAFGDLNGSGNQQAFISVARTSQDQAGNYSTFLCGVRYYGNGWGSYSGSTWYWSANFGGHQPSGSFNVPYAERNNSYKDLYWAYLNHGHDAAGNLGAWGASCWIDTNHTSVGDGGASTTEGASPRIPKPPSPPGQPSFSEITPTSVRVSWSGSGDNGGSGIDGYLLRWRTASPSDGPGYADSFQNNTSRVITGLTPGQSYWFGVYAHNGSAGQWSGKSADNSLQLPSGAYVSNGSAWIAQGLRVSNGSAWSSPLLKVSDGDSWEAPLVI